MLDKKETVRQFRVRRYDSRNWVIEEFLPGNINPFTGLMAEDYWKIIGYYGKLSHLVIYLLDKSIILPDNATGKEILQAIKDAEQNILKQLEEMEVK